MNDPDVDGDGIPNFEDNAALTYNVSQVDEDHDGWGDPTDPDPGDASIPGNSYVAELNGPYFYNPDVDSFVSLSAAGSETPVGL